MALAAQSSDASSYPVLTPLQALMIPTIASVGQFMNGLDQFIVTTSLPQMADSLHEPPLRLSLTVTAYLFSLAIFTPMSGWVSDRLGARNVYCMAICIFTLASALCGLSTTLPMLVASRILQGIGGAMLMPVGQLVVLRSFPKQKMMRVNNYMIIATLIGPMCGPLLGGFLTTYFSWPWIFYVNLPVGLLNLVAAWIFFPRFKATTKRPFDFVGFVLVGLAIGLLQVTVQLLSGADDAGRRWETGGALVATMAIVALYLLHARRSDAPLLDLRLLRIKTLKISLLSGGVSTIGPSCMVFLTPLLFQIGFGLNAMESGSRTFIMAGASILARVGATRLLNALGFRNILVWNSIILAVLIGGTALLQPDTPAWFTLFYLFLFGLPRAIQMSGIQNLAYSDVPPPEMSRFTALFAVSQQTWNTFAVGCAAALLSIMTGPDGKTSVTDFRIMFVVAAIVMLSSLVGFLRLKPDAGAHVSGHRAYAKPKEAAAPLADAAE